MMYRVLTETEALLEAMPSAFQDACDEGIIVHGVIQQEEGADTPAALHQAVTRFGSSAEFWRSGEPWEAGWQWLVVDRREHDPD